MKNERGWSFSIINYSFSIVKDGGGMEVKPGYKMTEVGVIPEEWEVKSLSEVVDFANGKPHEKDIKVGGRYLLITLDSIDINGKLKNQHKQTDIWDDSLKKNDLVAVLSDLAHGNLLGLCDLIPQDGRFVLNQRMGRLRRKIDADPYFIRLQINRRQYHFKARGQGTSQRHIYQRDFDALLIPFAPPPEQRAIAQALSDVDALLATLDQMIAKKRDLKQAAMQQLLTGKTRLPGFSGDWVVKQLGEVATCFSGGTPPTGVAAYYGGDIFWITSGDLNKGYITEVQGRITKEGLVNSASKMVDKDTLLIALYGATSGIAAITKISAAINQAVLAIVPHEDNSAFLYFQLTLLKEWLIATYTQGGQPNLSGDIVKSVELKLPTVSEQIAIATILTDMDAELFALEARRDKTRNIKQAMMQELLTGRIRLVNG